ncbi:unnamed protein product [Zymoseptoria tritici ST99CH_1E4]|uniref:Pal1 cell morphology n=2 Tax=Zymoseptoria tritici TaxID=1047171 RepID=F9XBY4_ZYMTI|nr:uncharacterized protein MYCGRDRAFT_72016 [Zymoseptoria tritici IPO323]EGP87637.1 hypothetical protein MYCGRDRAFT_72016 [Zymoseptoria tritici IPO323]SMR52687.1 unnamed protein product [Zymoseptoria tritici ST99CH_1E4]
MSSKSAAAVLIDPLNAPEPSAETGPGSHFQSTYAPASQSKTPSTTTRKLGASSTTRPLGSSSSSSRDGSPRVPDYRSEAFAQHDSSHRRVTSNGSHRSHRSTHSNSAIAPGSHEGSPVGGSKTGHHRRSSSLSQRYPGDMSHQPLDIIRRDSKKAARSPHLNKRHLPGPDTIDRLDPALGGKPYHHEGPYDAALMSRNNNPKYAPIAALQETNQEAIKATPQENIRDALERHQPLDGVAIVPPGVPDRFGRTYEYEEGADLMHEDNPDGPGYKRWPGKDYDKNDLKGKSEPAYSLDRHLRKTSLNDNGIEMSDRSNKKDHRDPVELAGGESKYVDMEFAKTNDHDAGGNAGVQRSGSLRAGLKKRIGSLRRKKDSDA